MTENKQSINHNWTDADDAPDLSRPSWVAKFAATPKQRGRPKSARTKISTTIRLDPDIIDHFKKQGRGWQSRINEILRTHLS